MIVSTLNCRTLTSLWILLTLILLIVVATCRSPTRNAMSSGAMQLSTQCMRAARADRSDPDLPEPRKSPDAASISSQLQDYGPIDSGCNLPVTNPATVAHFGLTTNAGDVPEWMYACISLCMHRSSPRCLEQASCIQEGARSRASSSIFVAMTCHRCFYIVLYCFSYSLRYHQASLSYLAFHHSHICSGHRLCQVYSVDSIARLLLSSPGYS